MRSSLLGLAVAAATVLIPLSALAGNQEIAQQIANNLKRSGQLSDYEIGVKYQDGTVWLRGRVGSHEQIYAAQAIASQTPGVQRVFADQLVITNGQQPVAGAGAQQVSAVQPLPPVQPLQQVAGATAPEQLPRQFGQMNVSQSVASNPMAQQTPIVQQAPIVRQMQTVQPAPMAAVPQAVQQAQLVPSSYDPSPAQPASAATPTPANPLPAEVLAPTPYPAATPPALPQKKRYRAAPQPISVAYAQPGTPIPVTQVVNGGPMPAYVTTPGGAMPARYDQPYTPNYSWPSYATYPNYAGLTYPQQYSPTAWPYIGPFYPYPQVPLGWRKVSLEWHDGWWMLDFDDCQGKPWRRLFH